MYHKQYASKKQNSSKTKQKPKQTKTKQSINGNPSKLKKKKKNLSRHIFLSFHVFITGIRQLNKTFEKY